MKFINIKETLSKEELAKLWAETVHMADTALAMAATSP